MKALSYLLITRLKNRILAIRKKPAMMILYIIILLIIIVSMISLLIFNQEFNTKQFTDERIIFMAIAGFGLLFMFTFAMTGLSTGSSLFTMADVGLLFVAPISSKRILIYGLISSIGKALLAAIFILYQSGTLIQFGYGLKEIITLFLIYAILVLFNQLVSIGIYIYSNGNPSRKNIVKAVLYLFIGVVLASIFLLKQREQITNMEAILRTVDSKWFGYIPIAGWSVMLFKGISDGIAVSIIVSLLLFLCTGILILSLLTAGQADYYEDVLVSTEVNFLTMKAAKEGRTVQKRSSRRIKVRDEDVGFLKGSGAFAIASKHILEMKRSSRFVFVDAYTAFITIGAGIVGYNLKNMEQAIYGIFATLIYLQFFFTVFGRLKFELLKPYIFLIPEKSMKKVVAASLSSLLKPCVDSLLVFGVLAAVGMADPLTCFFLALAYSASGAVFTGITLVYQRFLGGQPNRLVQAMIGLTILIIVMAPSITLSVVAAFLLPASLEFLCTLPYTVFCLLFSFLMILGCGDLINKSEFTGKL